MVLFLRILALLVAGAIGASFALYFMNKKSKYVDGCTEILAKNRKKLISDMNKSIKDSEDRISPENHEKRQKELESVDWDKIEDNR